MIKKLKIKFVIISLVSITIFLGLILVIVNATNMSIVASKADQITLELAKREGEFPEAPGEENGFNRPEARYDTRYFCVKIDKEGNVVMINVDHTISYTEEEAREFALSVYKNKSKTGWDGNFRYRIYKSNKEYTIVSVDFSRELEPSKRVLTTSLVVFVSGIVISLVGLIGVSGLVVKPIIDNSNKQKYFIDSASRELKDPVISIEESNKQLEIQYGENDNTNNISKQIRKLTNVVNKLNDLTNIDSVNTIEEFVKVDLTNITNSVSKVYVDKFKNLNKELNIQAEEGVTLKGNEDLLKQLLDIILDNALKYSIHSAYLTIKKENERIIIEEINDANIENGNLEQVFENFYRTNDARVSSIEGTGLNLSIAKKIVNLHGGRINAKGEEGNFTITVEL